jgi:IS605 OrfB family transposase
MKLVEQHVIKQDDPRFALIDQAAFASKNLYNQANYQIRQAFIHEGKYLPYAAIFHRLKPTSAYCALPRKVSNSILIQLHTNWIAFFKEMDACYLVEVVYQKAEQPAVVDPQVIAALDLGVNQLAALTSTKPGFHPVLVNGRPLKDLNHYYNQQRAHHQSRLARHNRKTSRKLDRITTKRNRRVTHYLHTASRRIIDLLVAEGIGTLVIGKNRYWKQDVEMGKRNNQQFVQIPHARFIDLLTYKAQCWFRKRAIHPKRRFSIWIPFQPMTQQAARTTGFLANGKAVGCIEPKMAGASRLMSTAAIILCAKPFPTHSPNLACPSRG